MRETTMLNLKKYFQPSSTKPNVVQTKNFKWFPNYERYESVYNNTVDSLIDSCYLLYFKAFAGNKSCYRIDEEYIAKNDGSGKNAYHLILTSDYPLVDMCVKQGGTKKTAALKISVLSPSGDKIEKRKIIQDFQLKAEEHYAQALKSLCQSKEI